MEHSKIRVLLVDDHDLVRDGIKSLIQADESMEVVAEASTGETAIGIVQTQPVDVAIMDLHMPEMGGIEATKLIAKENPETKVLVLTADIDESTIKKALEAGAAGYILKDIKKEVLIEAIKKVAAGENFYSHKVSAVFMKGYVDKGDSFYNRDISKREQEVLQLIVEGMTNKEIAEELILSVRTIDSHRRSLLKKMDVHNSVALTKKAIEKGYIDLRLESNKIKI